VLDDLQQRLKMHTVRVLEFEQCEVHLDEFVQEVQVGFEMRHLERFVCRQCEISSAEVIGLAELVAEGVFPVAVIDIGGNDAVDAASVMGLLIAAERRAERAGGLWHLVVPGKGRAEVEAEAPQVMLRTHNAVVVDVV
jgi:hypothetical protein